MYPTNQILFFIVEGIVCLLIISINTMVLSLFVGSIYLLNKYPYLVQLSIIDLLVGLATPTFTILSEVFHIPNTFYLCILTNSTINLMTAVSVLTLCAVSVHSLIAVRYKRLKEFSNQTCVSCAVMLAVWLVAGVENTLINFLWHEPVEKFNAHGCSYRNVIPLEWSVYVQLFGFYVVALVFMSVIYFLIFLTFRQSAKISVSKTATSQLENWSTPQERRLARSVSVIFLLFTVRLPLYLLNLGTYLHPNVVNEWGSVYFSVTYAAIVLGHSNAFFNALVYCLSCRELRRRFVSKYPCVQQPVAYYIRKQSRRVSTLTTSTLSLEGTRKMSGLVLKVRRVLSSHSFPAQEHQDRDQQDGQQEEVLNVEEGQERVRDLHNHRHVAAHSPCELGDVPSPSTSGEKLHR